MTLQTQMKKGTGIEELISTDKNVRIETTNRIEIIDTPFNSVTGKIDLVRKFTEGKNARQHTKICHDRQV